MPIFWLCVGVVNVLGAVDSTDHLWVAIHAGLGTHLIVDSLRRLLTGETD